MCKAAYAAALAAVGGRGNHQAINKQHTLTAMTNELNNCEKYRLKQSDFVDNNIPILKGIHSIETLMTEYLLSAQPLFGSYRRLVKLTTQQDDYAAIYATEFEQNGNTYTCFINGRPLGFNMDFGNLNINDNNNIEDCIYFICKLLGDNHLDVNNPTQNGYKCSSYDDSIAKKYLYSKGASPIHKALNRNLQNSNLQPDILNPLFVFSIDKPYHTPELENINEKTYQQIPHHSSLISCVNLITIRNIKTNPELIVSFGKGGTPDDIVYRSGNVDQTLYGYRLTARDVITLRANSALTNLDTNTFDNIRSSASTTVNNAQVAQNATNDNKDTEYSSIIMQTNSDIPFVSEICISDLDVTKRTINAMNVGGVTHTLPAQTDAPGQEHPQNTGGYATKTTLPCINNTNRVSETCISAINVRNSITYGISVGQKIKTIFNNNFVEEIQNVLTKVDKYEFNFNELKAIMINSYLCGLPVVGDLSLLSEWLKTGLLFKEAFDYDTNLRQANNTWYGQMVKDILVGSNVLSLNQYDIYSNELNADDKYRVQDYIEKAFKPEDKSNIGSKNELNVNRTAGAAGGSFVFNNEALVHTLHNVPRGAGLNADTVNNNLLSSVAGSNILNESLGSIPQTAAVNTNYRSLTLALIIGTSAKKELLLNNVDRTLVNLRAYQHTYGNDIRYGQKEISYSLIGLLHAIVFRPDFNTNTQALILVEPNSNTFDKSYDKKEYQNNLSNILTDLTTINRTNGLVQANDKVHRKYFAVSHSNLNQLILPFIDDYKNNEPDPLISKSLHSEANQRYDVLEDEYTLPKVYTFKNMLLSQTATNNDDIIGFSTNGGNNTAQMTDQLNKFRLMKNAFNLVAKRETNEDYIEYSNPNFAYDIKKELYEYAFDETDQLTSLQQMEYTNSKKLTNNVFTILNQSLLPIETRNGVEIRTNILDNINPDRNVIVGNMLGGYNNIYSSTLIGDGTKNLIKMYYYDNQTPIYKKITPGAIEHDGNFTNMIVSYYNKRMLTLKPVFDRYLYVEILYNSALLKQFITKTIHAMDQELRNNPADLQLVQTLKYLRNAFNIFGNDQNNDYTKFFNAQLANYPLGNRPNGPMTNDELKSQIINPIIYQNITLSPSEISRALRKIYDNFNDNQLVEQDKGKKDMFRSIGERILELDKYIIFVGTLAKFLKSLGYHSNEYNTTITYSKNGTVDISPI